MQCLAPAAAAGTRRNTATITGLAACALFMITGMVLAQTPSAARYEDANGDGRIDRIVLTGWPGTVTANAEAGDWTVNIPGMTNESASAGSWDASIPGYVVPVTFSVAADQQIKTDVSGGTISYSATAGTDNSLRIGDTNVPSFSLNPTDGCGPVIVMAVAWQTGIHGIVTNYYRYIDVKFSEDVAPDSTASGSRWTVPGSTYVSSITRPSSDTLRFTLHRYWNSGITSPSLQYAGTTSGSDVRDTLGNRMLSQSATAVAVRIPDTQYRVVGFEDTRLFDIDAGSATGVVNSPVQLRQLDFGVPWLQGDSPRWTLYEAGSSVAGTTVSSPGDGTSDRTTFLIDSSPAQEAYTLEARYVSSLPHGASFISDIRSVRIRNTNWNGQSVVTFSVPNRAGTFNAARDTHWENVETGTCFAAVKATPIIPQRVQSSRIFEEDDEVSLLDIDLAGNGETLEQVKVRFVTTSYGQFDPAIDLKPLADGAGSGVLLKRKRSFGGQAAGVVQLSTTGLEWSPWKVTPEGKPYREVTLKPLNAIVMPASDEGSNDPPELEIAVQKSSSFGFGDAFYAEIPDHGFQFSSGTSGQYPGNKLPAWNTRDGDSGTALNYYYRCADSSPGSSGTQDGRWNATEEITMSSSLFTAEFFDGGNPFRGLTSGSTSLLRNDHGLPNRPAGQLAIHGNGDDFWYDVGGQSGVYDAGIDIPICSDRDAFYRRYAPNQEGARSVEYRASTPAVITNIVSSGQSIAANSDATAILGIRLQDSGRTWMPRILRTLDEDGGDDFLDAVTIEAVSKNMPGGNHGIVWDGTNISVDGEPNPVAASGDYILNGRDETFFVARIEFSELAPASPASPIATNVVVSNDTGRDIQQPTDIPGVRVHAVGPGNAVGSTVTLNIADLGTHWEIARGDHAIQRNLAEATDVGGGQTRFTTTAAHGLTVGDDVRIAGTDGGAYDGIWQVAGVSASTTFDIAVAYAGGITTGTVSRIDYVAKSSLAAATNVGGGRTRFTTTAAHGLTVGDDVRIAGTDGGAYDGIWQVAGVSASTTFDIAVTYAGGITSGTVSRIDLLAQPGTGYRYVTVKPGTNQYLVLQVDLDRVAAGSQELEIYSARGRTITPLLDIAGLEIMAVDERLEHRTNYRLDWDGTAQVLKFDSSTTGTVTPIDSITYDPSSDLDSATDIGGGQTRFTTTAAHGLADGNTIRITGTDVDAYNDIFFSISNVPDTTSFDIAVPYDGDITTGTVRRIVSLSYGIQSELTADTPFGSGVTRFTTEASHGLSAGDEVHIRNTGISAYDGVWEVSNVPTGTTFEIPVGYAGDPAVYFSAIGDTEFVRSPLGEYLVVRQTGTVSTTNQTDYLTINQTRLGGIQLTLGDVNGFPMTTHLKPLTTGPDSGVAIYRDANGNGVLDGEGTDEFVPLRQTPIWNPDGPGSAGQYLLRLYPEVDHLSARLDGSPRSPAGAYNYFVAVKTTNDVTYGDQFRVNEARAYEPTELPSASALGTDDITNTFRTAETGGGQALTVRTVTNTIFVDLTTPGQTIDAGWPTPTPLFGVDHWIGNNDDVYLTAITFTINNENNFDPKEDLLPIDGFSSNSGLLLYAGGSRVDFAHLSFDVPGGTQYIFYPTGNGIPVPKNSSGIGTVDLDIRFIPSSDINFMDAFSLTILAVDGLEYTTGYGSPNADLTTHTITATVPTLYGDLSTHTPARGIPGLLINAVDPGIIEPPGEYYIVLFYDPATDAWLLWDGGPVQEVDMTATKTYVLTNAAGEPTVTLTFDPQAFLREDTLVDGDGTTTTARGVASTPLGSLLTPLSAVSDPTGKTGDLYYVDHDASATFTDGDAIVLAGNDDLIYDDGIDTIILGTVADGEPMLAFAPSDRLAFHDADADGAYTDAWTDGDTDIPAEDILRDTDGIYSLPWMDRIIDVDGTFSTDMGTPVALREGDPLVAAHTVSLPAGENPGGSGGLYYYDADQSGGYSAGDDIVLLRNVPGQTPPLTFQGGDAVIHDGGDGVQVTAGNPVAQFVAQDRVWFERGGPSADNYDDGDDIVLATSSTYTPPVLSAWFRTMPGTRTIRAYNNGFPAPFNTPESAIAGIIGIDAANGGDTSLTLDSITVRFENVSGFNALSDLRALLANSTHGGVLLYRDADGDGVFNPRIDTLVPLSGAPSWSGIGTAADPYRLTLSPAPGTGLNRVTSTIRDGIYDFFVAVQPSLTVNDSQAKDIGDRFRTRVDSNDIVFSGGANRQSISAATVTVDTRRPSVVFAMAYDHDQNGFLDELVIQFHEPLIDSDADAGDWKITDADGITDLTPTADSQIQLGTTQVTIELPNDRGTTGPVTFLLDYDDDLLALFDAAGNPALADGISVDEVVPRIVKVTTHDNDAAPNGLIDHLWVTFSEEVDFRTFSNYVDPVTPFPAGADWSFGAYAGLTIHPAGKTSDTVIRFTVDEADLQLAGDTDATPNLVAAAGAIEDMAGNPLPATSAMTTDQAPPVPVDAYVDRGLIEVPGGLNIQDGTVLTVVFSEPVFEGTATLDVTDITIDRGTGDGMETLDAFGITNDDLEVVDGVLEITIAHTDKFFTESALINLVSPTITPESLEDAVGLLARANADDIPVRGLGSVQVTLMETLDTDLDGYLDAVRITFNRDISDASLDVDEPGVWTLTNTVTGIERADLAFLPGGPEGDDDPDDNVIYLSFREAPQPDTGAQLTLEVVDSGLLSLNDEPFAEDTFTVDSIDKAAPQIMDVTTFDADEDGQVDAAMLRGSELMNPATLNPADFTIGGNTADAVFVTPLFDVTDAGGGKVEFTTQDTRYLQVGDTVLIQGTINYNGMHAITAVPAVDRFQVEAAFSAEIFNPAVAVAIPAGDKVVLLLTGANQVPGTEYKPVDYTPGLLADLAGNPLAEVTDAGLRSKTDRAKPRVAAARTLSDRAVEVTFTEAVTNIQPADLTSDFGAVTFDNVSSVSPDVHVWSRLTPTWNTDANGGFAGAAGSTDSTGMPRTAVPNLSIDEADINDLALNSNAALTNWSATIDNAAPVIVQVTVRDDDTDGEVETAEVLFSEPISDASVAASMADFSLGGEAITASDTGSTADDHTVVLTHGGVPGTDYQPLDYHVPNGVVVDLVGNPLAAGTNLGLVQLDEAKPVVLSARTRSDDSIEVTFSEAIDPASVDGDDLRAGVGDAISFAGTPAVLDNVVTWTEASETWNTDATGTSAGSGTDSNGSSRSAIPQFQLLADAVTDMSGNGNAPEDPFTIVRDGAAPVVLRVDSTRVPGIYTEGDLIPVQVHFSEIVQVTDTPVLGLNVGTGASYPVDYSSGSGTDTLTFNYTVGSGHNRITPEYLEVWNADALGVPAGSAIKDASLAANDAERTLPASGPNALSAALLEIDNVPPTITAAATIDQNTLRISFSEPIANPAGRIVNRVDEVGILDHSDAFLPFDQVSLDADGTVPPVDGDSYLTLYYHMTDAAKFWNTDATGTSAGAGTDHSGTSRTNVPAVQVQDGGLLDRAGQGMETTDFKATTDEAPPVQIAAAYRDYGADGSVDRLDVTFSEAVTFTADATFLASWLIDARDLTGLGTTANAASGSGSPTVTLTVDGTSALTGVPAGDLEPTVGYHADPASPLLDVPGNAAGDVAPVDLTDAAGPAIVAGRLVSRRTVELTLSEGIDDSGLAGTDFVLASFADNDVHSADTGDMPDDNMILVFKDAEAALLDLGENGTAAFSDPGVLADRHGVGNDQTTPIPVAPLSDLVQVTAPTSAAVLSYAVNPNIQVRGSAAARNMSSWTLYYAPGTNPANPDLLEFARQEGTPANPVVNDLMGTWNIDSLADGIYTLRLRVVPDDPTVPGWGVNETPIDVDVELELDATAPTVLYVYTDKPTGTYGEGETFNFWVVFSEPVFVTCSAGFAPRLQLNTTPPQAAEYVDGSGTDELWFTYTVQDGDAAADLDYASTTALQATMACKIYDVAANDADLTLPPPGDPGSVSHDKDIVIDTTGPDLLLYSPTIPLTPGDVVTYSYTPSAIYHGVPVTGRALADDITADAAPVTLVEVTADDGGTWVPADLDPVDGTYSYMLNLLDPLIDWGDRDLVTPYYDGLYQITVRAWDALGRSTETTVQVRLERDMPTADILMPPQNAFAMRGMSHAVDILVQAPYFAFTPTDWVLQGSADDDFSGGVDTLASGSTDAAHTESIFVPMPPTGDEYFVRLLADSDGMQSTVVHRFRLHEGISGVETVDADANGRIDGILVSFSAAVDIIDWDDPAYGIEAAFDIDGYTIVAADYSALNVNELLIQVQEKAAGFDSDAEPLVTYVDNHTILFADSLDAFVPDFQVNASDNAAPVLVAAESRSDRSIALFFSEPLDMATVNAADLTVDGGTVGFDTVNAEIPSDTVVWQSTDPAWNTDATGLNAGSGTDAVGHSHGVILTLTIPADAFSDLHGNGFQGVTDDDRTIDRAPPVLVSARTLSDRSVEATLSEAVEGINASDLTVNADTIAFADYTAVDSLVHLWASAADSWNTDATGASAGHPESTDSDGMPRNATVDVTMPPAAFADLAGNPFEGVDQWNGTSDAAPPVALTAAYLDLVIDPLGQTRVDQVDIRMSEPVALNQYEDVDWDTTTTPGTVGLQNETAVTTDQHTVQVSVLGALNITGGPDAPAIYYTRDAGIVGSLRDQPGNPADDFALEVADHAAPRMIGAYYRDTDADGLVDRIDVVFSEQVAIADDSGWSLLANDLPLDPASLGVPLLQPDMAGFSFAIEANAIATGVDNPAGEQEPVIQFDASGQIADRAPAANAMVPAAAVLEDRAGPVLVSVAAATQQVLTATFSEKLDGDTVEPGDFVHGSLAVVAVDPVDDWARARLTLDAPLTWGEDPGDIAFQAAGVVADPHGNPNQDVATVPIAPALRQLVYFTGPEMDTMHQGEDPIAVTGRCDVANGIPADDFDIWNLYFVQGQGSERKPIGDLTTILLATSNLPLPTEATFGDLIPSTHATPGIYEYTLILEVAFNTGEPNLMIYREVFAAADTPIMGTVNDGLSMDVDFQASTSTLAANWSGFTTGPLPPASYLWAGGTDPDGEITDIFPWESVGLTTAATKTGLTLVHGQTYYISMIALDAYGQPIGRNVSDGVRVDAVGPSPGSVSDGPDPAVDIAYQQSARQVAATWSGFEDDPEGGSGIADYQWAVFRQAGAAQAPDSDPRVLSWTPVGNVSAAQATLAPLTHAQLYYVGVRALDAVDNVGEHAYSDGFRPDLLPPVPGEVRDGPDDDIDMTSDPTMITANWDPFEEPDSGLMTYQYRLVKDLEQVTDGWERRLLPEEGALNVARIRFGVTKLLDGRIMVIGGWTGNDPLANVEIYDPETGAWTTTGALNRERFGCAVATLPDGDVIVAGGSNDSYFLTSVERYDSFTGTWTEIADLSLARENAVAALRPDGTVWVIGGRGDIDPGMAAQKGYTDLVEEINPATGTVSAVGVISAPRAGAAAHLLPGNRLIVAGGEGPAGASNITDIHDAGWTATTMPAARMNFASVVLPDGDLLAIGGQNAAGKLATVDRFDVDTATWRRVAPMSTPRAHFGAAWLESTDTVLAVGGINDAIAFEASCEEYNPDNDRWTAIESLNRPRGYHRLVTCETGRVAAVGGLADRLFVEETEVRRYVAPVSPWSATTDTSGVVTGLSLRMGETYYVQVRAFDHVGNRSPIAVSDGVMVTDFSEPPAVVTLVGPETVAVGETFDVMIYVQETNDQANGFRGGPVDVAFTAANAQVLVDEEFHPADLLAPEFTVLGEALTSGTLDNTSGLIDELGGATTANGLGEGEAPGVLYATIPFTATAAGAIVVNVTPGDSGLVLTPPIGEVPTNAVDYGAPLLITVANGVTLSIDGDPPSIHEGGTFVVRASLTMAATETVTVELEFGGTATYGVDYTVTTEPLVIAAGATSASTAVWVEYDGIAEPDETIEIGIADVISAGGGYAEVGEQSVSITIIDGGKPGDANGDGVVDIYDLWILIEEYGSDEPGPEGFRADFDGDGDVDYYDLMILIANYEGATKTAAKDGDGVAAAKGGPAATISLVGPERVQPGDIFDVDLYVQVDDPKGFGGGPLDLEFTAAALEYAGEFNTDTIIQAPFNGIATIGILDEEAGTIAELGGATVTEGHGVGTPVHYARLTFQAGGTGTATLRVSAGSEELKLIGGLVPFANTDYGETLTVAVAGDNVAPVAQDVYAQTALNSPVDLTLTGFDADGDAIHFNLPTPDSAGYPLHGTISTVKDGANGTLVLTYVPDDGFVGMDSFLYNVDDGDLFSDEAVVTVDVGAFLVDIAVSRQGNPYITLGFGMKNGASEAFSTEDGDALAPPPGFAGDSAAFVAPTDGRKLRVDVRNVAARDIWSLAVTVPGGDVDETWDLDWLPDAMPEAYAVILIPADENWKPQGQPVDMKANDNLTMVNETGGQAQFHFLVILSLREHVTLSLRTGWNLVGIPIAMEQAAEEALLANASILALYQYSVEEGYTVPGAILPGRAYWMYAENPVELELTGAAVRRATALNSGWNLVAPYRRGANPMTRAAVAAAWAWDPENGYYIPSLKDPAAIGSTMGLWIFALEPTVIWDEMP